MKKVTVMYLTINGFYTNGQSLCEKDRAMMPFRKLKYYLESAESRGLDFDFESETLLVDDNEGEVYERAGYLVIDA